MTSLLESLDQFLQAYDFVRPLVQYLSGYMDKDVALGVVFAGLGIISAIGIRQGSRCFKALNPISGVLFLFWVGYAQLFKYPLVLVFVLFLFMFLIYDQLPINKRMLYWFQPEELNIQRIPIVLYVHRITGLSVALQDNYATMRRVLFGVHVPVRLKGGLSTRFTENFGDWAYLVNYCKIVQESAVQEVVSDAPLDKLKSYLTTRVKGAPMSFEVDLAEAHAKPTWVFVAEAAAFKSAGEMCDNLSRDLATQQILHGVHVQRDVGARLKDMFSQIDSVLGLKLEKPKQEEKQEENHEVPVEEGVEHDDSEQATAGTSSDGFK